MVPICYEESLPNGPSATCAEFMATATEQYIKTVVGSVLAKTRSNLAGAAGALSINTRRFRQQLEREEQALSRGEVSRGVVSNLLPVETKEASVRRSLGLGDFRIALEIGGASEMGQMPTVVEDIMGGWPEGALEGWGRYPDAMDIEENEIAPRIDGVMVNGITTNGAHPTDNDSYGWEGGATKDRDKLFSLLDECLAIGST